jgi:hypothetical protein
MREVARKKMGYFCTPERVVRMIARHITLEAGETYSILDPCAGEGKAIELLRQELLEQHPEANIILYGIEADNARASQANERFTPTGGLCVKGSIENTHPTNPASILFFNPPYDTIRGGARMEKFLYDYVAKWSVINGGIMVGVFADSVLASTVHSYSALNVAINQRYELVGRWRFPMPEYDAFKQCVFIGKSRARAIAGGGPPPWGAKSWMWPQLTSDTTSPVAAIPVDVRHIYRQNLDNDDLRLLLRSSPVSQALVMVSQAIPPVAERPPNPLKSGHMALALGGGLSDGLVEKDGRVFLLRGIHKMCWVKVDGRYDKDNDKTIQTYRTRHELLVRCLLPNGNIEEYSSEPKQRSDET